jgi:hypothetical protein
MKINKDLKQKTNKDQHRFETKKRMKINIDLKQKTDEDQHRFETKNE